MASESDAKAAAQALALADVQGVVSGGKDGEPLRIKFEPETKAHLRLLQGIILFVLVHYFWYLFVAAAVVYALMALGWLNWYGVALLVAVYIPFFLNGKHKKTGGQWDWFKNHPLWTASHKYLSVECTREQELDAKKQYIFAISPHGILILSRCLCYGGLFERMFPGIVTRTLGATAMFLVPLCREVCLWCGAVDASKKTAVSILQRGWSLLVYPGGSREIFLTDSNSTDTALVRRSGFVRLAIENGCEIVPTFVFGEKWLYRHLHFPRAVTDFFLNTLRFPLLLFWGRWFTYMPLKRQLAIVYGKPLSVTKNPNPTDAEVAAVQTAYETAVRDIFERYKARYGYSPSETLTFVKG